MSNDNRQSERYDKELQVNFDFLYDAAAAMTYVVENAEHRLEKYVAISKNICASGLCLTSPHKLERGQTLRLEVYLPKSRQPIHMEGEVRWCRSAEKEEDQHMFDAGIRLKAVEGQSVDPTVHLDESYHVIWSNVLESIFGTFRKLSQESRRVAP